MDPDSLLLLTMPQASQLDISVRAQYIAMVTPRVGTQLRGRTAQDDLTNQGIAYLAANEIAIAGAVDGIVPFPVSSEKEGQLARTYSVAQLAQAGEYYAQSKWGMMYYGLRKQRVVTFGTYIGRIPGHGR